MNVYFSLGSNLGDREKHISEALCRMDEAFGTHYSALSKIIETEPFGFSGNAFLNAAVLYRIPAESPLWTLYQVKAIEREMGRTDLPEYDQRFLFKNRIIAVAYNPVTFLMTVLSH